MAKKAITLESSEKILFRCDSGFFENTLVKLLKEGFNSGLKDEDKVWISYETLPSNFSKDFPTENDLILRRRTITYKKLKEEYKFKFSREYSPEVEKQRSDFQFALLEKEGERRSAWGYYSQAMNYARAVEEVQQEKELIKKGDEEGLKELREKRKNKGNMLQIG